MDKWQERRDAFLREQGVTTVIEQFATPFPQETDRWQREADTFRGERAPLRIPFWEKVDRSFMAGVGDVIKGAGYALDWLGVDGEWARETGERIIKNWEVPEENPEDFEWSNLLDPHWLATRIPRALPFSLSLIPAAIIGAYGGVKVGTAAALYAGKPKLGAWGKTILGSLGATAMSRPIESALEAGSAYEAALARGATAIEAKGAGDRAFRENIWLAGMDIGQLALAFAPMPKGTIARRITAAMQRTAGVGVGEAVEEALQHAIQLRALGLDVDWLDPDISEAAALGMTMGIGLGGAGSVYTNIAARMKRNLTPELRKKVEEATAGKVGIEAQSAEIQAFDEITEKTEEGKAAAEKTGKEILLLGEQADAIGGVPVQRVGEATLLAEEPIVEPAIAETPAPIPPELEPLAVEARKYETVEKFIIGRYGRLHHSPEADLFEIQRMEESNTKAFETRLKRADTTEEQRAFFEEKLAVSKKTAEDAKQLRAMGFNTYADFYHQAVREVEPVVEAKVLPKPLEPTPEVVKVIADTKKEIIAHEGDMETTLAYLYNIFKDIKDYRVLQAELYRQGRARQAAAAKRGEIMSEEDFANMLGRMKGELAETEIRKIRDLLPQEHIDSLFRVVGQKHKDVFKRASAGKALFNILDGDKVPPPSQLEPLAEALGSDFVELLLEKQKTFIVYRPLGLEIANIPRAMMTFLDVSFGFRQGIFIAGWQPRIFFRAFIRQFEWFFSQKAVDQVMEGIAARPNYNLAVKSKLPFTDTTGVLTTTEEAFFGAHILEGVPLLGAAIRASNRAFSTMANVLRMDCFDLMVKDMENLRLNPQNNLPLTQAAARFIGDATGRGDLPASLEGSAVVLNTFLFSPRLMASRLHLLNPVRYVKYPAYVRKQALKALFSYASLVGTVLGLAALAGGKVERDPRSADFMKIKIGDTRFDIMGGFQQYIVLASRLVSGEIVSSSTGKVMTLGEGFGARTRLDVLYRALEMKHSPIFSFAVTMLRGRTIIGEEINVPAEVGRRFVPMIIQDIHEIIREDPEFLPLAAFGAIGVGIQSYEGWSTENISRFYEIHKRAERGHAGIRKAKEERDRIKVNIYRNRYPEHRFIAELRRIERQLTELRTRGIEINEKDLTREEKESKSLKIRSQMDRIAKRAVGFMENRLERLKDKQE